MTRIMQEGLLDELVKIAEATKDKPLKRTLKNIALASLGGAAGTGVAMAGHGVLKNLIGPRYEKLMPATKLKIVAPLLGISSAALVAASVALHKEMTKKVDNDGQH